MDKSEFVQRSPLYYALAIAAVLRSEGAAQPDYMIKSQYPADDDFDPDPGTLLDRYDIWNKAVEWLLAQGLIRIRNDPFGPPIFSQSSDFMERWDALCADEKLPFFNFVTSGNNNKWLIPALYSLENNYVNLGIKPDDFESQDKEWSPIQIDLNEPEAKRAVEGLEHAIDEIRSDNGYSATLPHERDYVLEGLGTTLEKFRSQSVSPAYVRLGLERLAIAARRFAGSTKELVLNAARAALIEFSKKHFGDALNYLWRMFF